MSTNTNQKNDIIPWIEKYRPRQLNSIKQNQKLIDFFHESIETKNLSHYLFYGPPGTGKTSAILAIGHELFKEHFRSRVIEFNASDDRGINAVREKITKAAKKSVPDLVSEDGTEIPRFRIIVLDEADYLTEEAQDALRVIIEKYSSVTRFCFICNYISKMTDAIKSRCTPVFFCKLSNECMMQKLLDIAKEEKMNLPDGIYHNIIDISNGDMRKAIMLLQNIKYLDNYNKSMLKPFGQMSLDELKKLPTLLLDGKNNYKITENSNYQISVSISPDQGKMIIERILACKSIVDVVKLSREIISWSFPIDNVITQINNTVISTDLFSNENKAKIIYYSGKIFLRMKECANEHIQLSDYMSCIYGINAGLTSYDIL